MLDWSAGKAFFQTQAEDLGNQLFATLDASSHALLLAFLKEHPLKVVCTSPNFSIYVCANPSVITVQPSLVEDTEQAADITIKGELQALAKLAKSSDNIIPEGIHIEGQVHLLEKLQALLAQVDLDWPTLLEARLGSGPTQLISSLFQKGVSFKKGVAQQFGSDVSNYVRYEKKLVMTRHDYLDQRQKLTELRLQLDRADARLNHLNLQLNSVK